MFTNHILLFLSIPSLLTAIESDSLQFRNNVLLKLHQRFESGGPLYSTDFIEDLLTNDHGTQGELRDRLSSLIGTLDIEREKNSDLWKDIISKSSPEIESNRAEKLIRYWIQESRKILRSNNNHLLDKSMRDAARKSKVPFFQSKSYLLRTLEWATKNTQNIDSQRPFGILVSGKSNRFEINLDPLFLFFDSQDEAFVREQVREIQRFIIPSLVRRLPESERILWCIRERESNVLVKPDYKLTFSVESLSFTGSNIDVRPCIELEIEILDWKTKSLISKRPFSQCSNENGSSNTKNLSPFWNEIADDIRDLVILELN